MAETAKPAAPSGGGRAEYAADLARAWSHMPDVPSIALRFDDLSYVLHLKQKAIDREIKTVAGAFGRLALSPITLAKSTARAATSRWTGGPSSASDVRPFHVLQGLTGLIPPGRITLLLSPPGHGKTSFLRALAGRIPESKLTGTVRYNGMTSREAAAAGVRVHQLVQYVDQLDVHMPLLTVRETFAFAAANANVSPSLLGNAEAAAFAAQRVESVIKLLSLQNCANTIVGNDLFRGVSGGEKKRVTVGEALVTNARAFLMDEISTGLDSSVTFDIVSSIKTWASITQGTVVIALLQPTPEVYALFDDVILMREGRIAYHGPRMQLPGYLDALGFYPPRSIASAAAPAAPGDALAVTARQTSAPAGAAADMADWLVEVISHPRSTHNKDAEKFLEEKLREAGITESSLDLAGLRAGRVSRPSMNSLENVAAAEQSETRVAAAVQAVRAAVDARPQPPLDTDGMVAAFAASDVHQAMLKAEVPSTLELRSEFAKAQYGKWYPHSMLYHFGQQLWRSYTLTVRNSIFVTSRIVMAVFMALVLGSTYWRLGFEAGPEKFGLFLFAALHVAFANMSELPTAVENKYVCYKQVFSGQYPSLAYVLAVTGVHIPIALAECLVFTVIMYFMTGLVEEAGRFFTFVLIMFLVDLCMAALLRAFAFASPDMETAQVAPSPIISIQMLFAGFLITRAKMGWLVFLHYVSIFAYGLRALALNEFLADKYKVPAASGSGTIGEGFLQLFDFQTEVAWLWGGVGFLVFMYIAITLLSGVIMGFVRIEQNIGTSRTQSLENDVVAEADVEARQQQSPIDGASPVVVSPAGDEKADAASPSPVSPGPAPTKALSTSRVESVASALPFEPMTFTFQNISYSVPVTEPDPTDPQQKRRIHRQKMLLQDVSGYAKPGTLTALMGASGAGKTTLLDVIAGRKNTGVMKGKVLLNGFPKEDRAFSRLTAYVEQQDIHNAFATVREALQFSAALRLPASVSAEQREQFIEETLDVLELRDIADRKIGESGAADGLSPGQRKRLTIGVEVVSNAPIIFLDEPTTSLDSRNAQVVVRVMKNLALRGRTIITTIHQPSSELFFMMDNLLLLQRGGWQVYFGPLGTHKADRLRHYLEAIPGTPRCPRKMNPASWMLDVLAGTDSSGEARDVEEVTEISVANANGAADASSVVVRQASVKAQNITPSDTHPGRVDYQSILQSSAHWTEEMEHMAQLNVPKEGSKPVRFASKFARSWFEQFWFLLARANRSHMRNVDYNFTRIFALVGLMVLFGVVYYKVPADDFGGIQSQASVMFFVGSFIGMMNMNTAIPVMMRQRAVYYRERASYLYGPEVYALVNFLSEIPWIATIVMVAIPMVYFMVGFNPAPEAFFFFAFVVFIFTLVFVSIAQMMAALMPNIAIAQAVVGALIPLWFLFGGLFLREPNIPIGWKWMNIIDPIRYAFSALIAPQFYCAGSGCPTIRLPNSPVPIDRFAYVEQSFGVNYADRWHNVGYLVCFIVVFQTLHFAFVRWINHLRR